MKEVGQVWLSGLKKLQGRWGIYLLAVLCLLVALSQLAHCIDVHYENSTGMHLRRVFDACLWCLPLLFCRRKGWAVSWMLLVGAYLLSVIWYFRTYATIMPLSSYLMFHNTDGLLSYIGGSVALADLTILAPLLLFVVALRLRGRWWRPEPLPRRFTLGWIGVLAVLISLPYWPNQRLQRQQPLYLYGIAGARAFKEFGLANFWVYQFSRLQSVSEEDRALAHDYFAQQPSQPLAQLPVPEGRNLIVVLVESLQSWAIGLNHGGVEVTPVLNQLLKQDNTVYIPQMLSQVKDGRSSDAQLLINTGLLPLATGAASSLCADNTFPSLADALHAKGYYAASFLCDDRDFWNQGRTTVAYGFDCLYDGLQQRAPKMEADSLLFEAALRELPTLPQPFYAQLVTFSTHMPYDEVQCPSSPLLNQTFASDEVRNHLVAVQLFDRRLGRFFEGLKERGLYHNSVIVVVGDHEQVTFNQYEGRAKAEVADNQVPFLVLNSPLSTSHSQQVFGQVDLYPSLLQLMGCANYRFSGLGESVFADSVSRVAVFRTEESLLGPGAAPSPEVEKHRRHIWKVSDVILRMNYFAE